MGCAHKVFATEIDVELFEEAERGSGYGALKLAREPLACCAFQVEKAHESPEFALPQPALRRLPGRRSPDAIRAFDLRHDLELVKDRFKRQTHGRNRA